MGGRGDPAVVQGVSVTVRTARRFVDARAGLELAGFVVRTQMCVRVRANVSTGAVREGCPWGWYKRQWEMCVCARVSLRGIYAKDLSAWTL